MSPLKDFGIMLEPQLGMTMNQLIRTTLQVEEIGFGYLFRSDHLLPTDGRRGLDSPECWTSLGAIGAATRGIKFGPMVSPIGFHNPAMLAKMVSTVHSYSGGRLQLGIGAGWYESEYRAHGYEFPPFAARVEQFDEALKIILSMIRDGRVDFDGKHFSAHTDCLPRPSGRVHVIIGGRSKHVIRNAALYADEWNFFTKTSYDFVRGKKLLEETAIERKVLISETGPFLLGRTQSELEKKALAVISEQSLNLTPAELISQLRGDGSPCGTVSEFVEQVRKRIDAGVSRFYFQLLTPEDTSLIELLADTLKQGF